MTTQAEVLSTIKEETRLEEGWREQHGGTINPELLAMKSVLAETKARHRNFIRKRMALDVAHFQEHRIRPEDLTDWLKIRAEIHDVLPAVPTKLTGLSRSWKSALEDVIHLYGDPHGE